MRNEQKKNAAYLLNLMKDESVDIANEYGNRLESQSYEAMVNTIASLASKQAAICEILVKMLEEE